MNHGPEPEIDKTLCVPSRRWQLADGIVRSWSGSCPGRESLGPPGFAKAGPIERQENPMLRVRNFLSDESGVTAIEYALIASLIAVFIIVAVQLVGTQVSTVFNEIGTTLK
jgi:pilus assembly protein Flp/PilA